MPVGALLTTQGVAGTVPGDPVTRWSNGYARQFELVVPAAISGAVGPYEILVSESAPELKPAPGAGASSGARPFGAAAPWNVPVAALRLDPDGDRLCSVLYNSGSTVVGKINLTFSRYTYAIYETDGSRGKPAANRTIEVSFTEHGHLDFGNVPEGTLVPWNDDWIPAFSFWTGSNNDDNWLLSVNPTTGVEIDLWQGRIDVNGKLQVGSANIVAGDFRTKTLPVPSDKGTRGSGIQNYAMVVRPFEVAQGRIDHALCMSTRAAGPTFVFPGQKSDGQFPNGIPEGQRFFLRVSDAEIDAHLATLPAGLGTTGKASLRVIFVAMREYGWFVTDRAGAAAGLQFEDYNSADWASLGLQAQTLSLSGTNKLYPDTALDGLITLDRLRSVAPGPYAVQDGQLAAFFDNQPGDVRFELPDGTKLPHVPLSYDPSGRIAAVVRHPGLSGSVDNRVLMYAGNDKIAASEADRPGTFADAAAVYQPPSLADFSGNGRDLSKVGTTAVETANALSFGQVLRLSGAGSYQAASAAWLNGLNAYSLMVIAKADAGSVGTDKGLLSAGGIISAGIDDLSIPLLLRFDAAGHPISTPPANVLAYVETFTDPTAAGEQGRGRMEGDAGFQDTAWHVYGIMRPTDGADTLGIDGTVYAPPRYQTGAGRLGPITLGATPKLRLGAATYDSETGGWVGLLAYYRFGKGNVTPGWFSAFSLNYTNPRAFYGFSVARSVTGNRGPVATPKLAVTAASTAVTVNLLTGCTSPTGLALSLVSVGLPSGGTRTTAGSSVTYTPAAGTKADEMSFTIADSNGQQAFAKLRVVVGTAPLVASADSATCPFNGSVLIDVLANDSGPGTLSIQSFAQPAHGVVTANSGKLSYAAASGYSGADSFTYVLASSSGGTATATVSVTVGSAPAASVGDDNFVIGSAATVLDVLANDSANMTVDAIVGAPVTGTASITGAGASITYTPAAGDTGPDSLVYRARNLLSGVSALAFCSVDIPSGGDHMSGFWSDPNLIKTGGGAKTARSPTSNTPAAFNTLVGQFKSGTYSSATDYILVTGTITGNVTIDAAGTSTHPLVVMATAPSDKMSFGSRAGFRNGTVFVKGQWVWLYQLKCLQTDNTVRTEVVRIQASNCFVTRCQIDASCGIRCTRGESSTFYCIGYNRFTGDTNPDDVGDTNQAQMYMYCSGSGALPDNGHIYFNIFTQDTDINQIVPRPSNPKQNISYENHAVYSGNGLANPSGDRFTPYDVNLPNVVAEYNYFTTRRTRACYMKHAFTFRYNHVKSVSAFNTENVSGRGKVLHMGSYRGEDALYGVVACNRVEGGENIGVQSWYHEILYNILTDGCDINLFVHSDKSSVNKTLLGAKGARVIGNQSGSPTGGTIAIGYSRDDPGYVIQEDLGDLLLEGNQGPFVDDNGATISFGASGHPTGTHPNIDASTITKRDSITYTPRDGTNYSISKVPTLNSGGSVVNASTAGPRGLGATWGGGGGGKVPGAAVSFRTDSSYLADLAVQTPAGSGASATQASDYVQLTGGTTYGDANQRVAIVGRTQVGPGFRVTLDYMPLETNVGTGGVFNTIYLVRGNSPTTNLKDLAATFAPNDASYDGVAKGIRFTWDTQQPGGTGNDQIGAKALKGDGTLPDLSGSRSVTGIAFPRNQWSRLAFTVLDDTCIAAAILAGGTVKQQLMTDANLTSLYSAQTALNVIITASAQRSCRIRNIVVTPI